MSLLRRLTAPVLPLLVTGALATGPLVSGGPVAPSSAPSGADGVVAGERVQLVSATVKKRVKRALRIARRHRGDPYEYGAEGPDRFDCSGLVYFATHRAGFDDVPRTSAEQGRFMRHIGRGKLRRGDFLFFTGSSGVYHVGIYVGRRDGTRAVLHAPKPGPDVRVETVWTDSWFAATLRA